MSVGFRNIWTTIFGILAALGNQAANVGAKVPETKGEVIYTLLSFVFAAFGIFAKDAATGSQPK